MIFIFTSVRMGSALFTVQILGDLVGLDIGTFIYFLPNDLWGAGDVGGAGGRAL